MRIFFTNLSSWKLIQIEQINNNVKLFEHSNCKNLQQLQQIHHFFTKSNLLLQRKLPQIYYYQNFHIKLQYFFQISEKQLLYSYNIFEQQIQTTMLRNDIIIPTTTKKPKLKSQKNFYITEKLIGQGTFGKVYLGKDKRNNQQVAIKSVLQDKRYKNRQLSIICKLDHPNIIKMNDYFFLMENGKYYLNIVMDYIPDTLQRILKTYRKNREVIPAQLRRVLAFQLFKGLYYMKINKICHRDLKPSNILINEETYQLKICDFGSAKIIDKAQNNVAYICSRYYRAPELLFGSTQYSTQIDMWSAGCIITQFLTSDPIFPGDSSIQQLIQIVKILGTPCQQYLQKFTNNCFSIPKIKGKFWVQILSKYDVQEQLIDLIEKILTFDTKNRLSPFQALIHPYFKNLLTYNEYLKKLPQLLNFETLKNTENKYQIDTLQKIYQYQMLIKQKLSDSSKTTCCVDNQ